MRTIKKIDAMALLGLLFLLALVAQTMRSIYIDSYNLAGNHTDLLGFVISIGIGFLCTVFAVRERLLLYTPLILIGFFLLLLGFNVAFNSEESIVSVVFSRYGVLTWLLMGMLSAISIYSVRVVIRLKPKGRVAKFSSLALYLFLMPIAWLVYIFMQNPPIATISYQIVASNGIILICITAILLQAFRVGQFKFNLAVCFFLVLASFLVFSIALMQSTGIVAFWILGLPIILTTMFSNSRLLLKIVGPIAMAVVVYWLVKSYFLNDLLEGTRLSAMSDGVSSVSSVHSRTELLSGFMPQFMVAPIFGNFNAEVVAGFYSGEYVHSLLLSLLTHTGVLGFILLMSAVVYVCLKKKQLVRQFDVNGRLGFRFFVAVTILACIYAFFTWTPFWFLLGFMCVKADRHCFDEVNTK